MNDRRSTTSVTARSGFRRGKLAGLLWFLGIILAVYGYWFVMANFVIHDFWDPSYAWKCDNLRARMRDYPGHPLWLVMGSSRVVFGFKPETLEPAMREKGAPLIYNFGLSGVGLFREYIYFRRLLEDGFQPRRVVIEIFDADIVHEIFAANEAPMIVVRARKNELADFLSYSTTPPDFVGNWWRSRWDPAFKYGMTMANQTRSWSLLPLPGMARMEKIAYDQWGWALMENATSEKDYQEQFGVNQRHYGGELAHITIAPNSGPVLHKFLDLCRERGIDAVLLEMPEADDFRALHTPEGDAALARWVAGFVEQYNVPLINASTWIERSGFSDGHHLNGGGAEKFTRRLGEELFKTP